jgi:hypothetical protein
MRKLALALLVWAAIALMATTVVLADGIGAPW